MDFNIYLIFLTTTVLLILVPGPAAITVASQGSSHGLSYAFRGVLGVATADIIFFALSATGIASLILASNVLFSIIKWLGILYLMYLGLAILFGKSDAISLTQEKNSAKTSRLFYQGLIVQLANPKALLYFSALLPQFIETGRPIVLQIIIMGTSCFAADLIIYSAFSYFGDKMSKGVMKAWVVKTINNLAGGALICAGFRMATIEYDK